MDVMGDSEARIALASANGEYLRLLADNTATTEAKAKAYERAVVAGHAVKAEEAAAVERSCVAAETVLDFAANLLKGRPSATDIADAARTVADGYLALAEFRQSAADAPLAGRALTQKLRRIDS